VKTLRVALAALCVFSLAGCIDSAAPILKESKALFGPTLKLQLYTLHGGFAADPERVDYKWDGALYAPVPGGAKGYDAFSVHPFKAGTFIIQSRPTGNPGRIEYAVIRKLADGVFQVNPIDEVDAGKKTRAAYCGKANGAACRIETRGQLFAFARGTAARPRDKGGLVIRLPEDDKAEK
jgi:hypothetical protein